jgi:hypothetical protein
MVIDDIYRRLVEQLAALRKRILLTLWAERLMAAFVRLLLVVGALALVELTFRLPSVGRWPLLLVGLGVLAAQWMQQLAEPLRCQMGWDDRLSDDRLAERFGEAFVDIRDRLRNAMQLYRKRTDDNPLFSKDLTIAAVESAGLTALDHDFTEIHDSRPLHRSAKLLAVTAVAWALCLTFWAGPLTHSLSRVMQPSANFPLLPNFTLLVEPGNTEIVRGDSLTVRTRIVGENPDNLQVQWEENKSGDTGDASLAWTSDEPPVHAFESVARSFRYRVTGIETSALRRDRTYQSPWYQVDVRYRPEVRRLKLRLEPPTYTRLTATYLDDNIGDVSALKGTRVIIEATTNKPVEYTALEFESGRITLLKPQGTGYQGEFNLEQSDRYAVALRDKTGLENGAPIDYWVSVMADEYPIVQIMEPGRDIDLDDRMQVELAVRVLDDFGFSRARLRYAILRPELDASRIDTVSIPMIIPDPNRVSQELTFSWQLGQLPLAPEDVIQYFVEVWDNDNISGPKKSVSETFHLRFPSIDEIFAEMEDTQDEGIMTLEDLLEEQREVQETLKDLAEDFRRDPDMDWEEQRELDQVLQQHEETREKVDEVRKAYEEMLEKMESQDIVSSETLQKFMEMQELFEEIMTSELQDQIKKLQDQMQQDIKPEDMQAALDQLQLTQDDYMKRLERTVDILKQVQLEQQMDQAVKLAEEMVNRQQEIMERIPQPDSTDAQSDESKSADMQQLAKEERNLQEDLQQLDRHVDKLMEEHTDIPKTSQQQLDAAQQMMESPSLNNNMESARQAMEQQQAQQAMQQAQEARREMQQIRNQLDDARQSMMEQQKQQLTADMSRVARDMVELSRRQESIKKELTGLDRTSARYRELAQQQADVAAGLNRVAQRLSDLSRQTFFITPQMGQGIGQAFQQMQQALSLMEERNNSAAQTAAGGAMSALNATTMQMGEAMQQVMQGSSPSGLQEYLKQLEQMANAQQGINNQTMELPFGNKPGSRIPGAQQALMQRLAEQQRMLQQSLQQMAQEMASREDMLGDMGALAQQMEEVVKDLAAKNITDRTLQQQRRILSRLLDAQRSMQRRDYSRKRKSETGQDVPVVSPGALPADLGESLRQLQQELLRALDEGYSKDYEQLIRKYFEALSRRGNAATAVP